MAEGKKNILVIRYSPVKIFFQSLPAIAAIREHHKNDNLVLLTDETLFEYAKKIPLFDRVWLDIRPHWLEIPSVIDIIKRLKKGQFSRVYDLSFTQQANWYFRLMGIKKPEWNGNISWCKFPYIPPSTITQHYQDYIRNQVAVAGVNEVSHFDYSSIASPVDVPLPNNFAMITAAGNKSNIPQKWRLHNYAALIDRLHDIGITSVLVGDNGDDYWLNKGIADICQRAKPLNISGKTDFGGVLYVASKALFCVGNDTAPTHMAALAGTKTAMLLSRFSPAEIIAPKVQNLAVIEEAYLENVTVDRVYNTLNDFCHLGLLAKAIKAAPEKRATLGDETAYKVY
jgi:ADP-heptose:LPS heptosyltransferase